MVSDTNRFVMGVYAGAYAGLGFFTFREIDREGRRIGTGLEGEERTARELRRLRRLGWRVVHNLQFAYGDVDHIAIGPGGVAVIESKAGNADWQWHVDHGIPGRWLGQVRKNGQRVAGADQTVERA